MTLRVQFRFCSRPPFLRSCCPMSRLRIITTGGTIDKIYFDATSDYQVGTPQIAQVLAEANVAVEFVVEQACQKDSLDLTDADRAEIRRRVEASPERHILITHGTDTMTDTA